MQGFTVIGKVDKRGKACRLCVKADIRRALCFPGDSTLMVSHLLGDNSPTPLALIAMDPQNADARPIAVSHETSNKVDLIDGREYSGKLATDMFPLSGMYLVQSLMLEIAKISLHVLFLKQDNPDDNYVTYVRFPFSLVPHYMLIWTFKHMGFATHVSYYTNVCLAKFYTPQMLLANGFMWNINNIDGRLGSLLLK